MKAPVVFVNLKSDLTFVKELHEQMGNHVYRTRAKCNCKGGNIRQAIIAIDPATELLDVTVIRCKSCTAQQKGGNHEP
ncbi:MAG: hypothetical protein ACOXZ9_03690 [Bacteroidales bacterium]|jgi:hypothetical protein